MIHLWNDHSTPLLLNNSINPHSSSSLFPSPSFIISVQIGFDELCLVVEMTEEK